LTSAISFPSIASLTSWAEWQPMLIAALSIAFIASAETLLSAAAVDQMHHGPRTRYDKELAAQGLGNMVSGMLGALPMTGVIVRSATNVHAGARSSKSEILHSVWLLIFVVLFPFVLRWIPTASLAAILVYTGFKLVDLKTIRDLRQYGKSEVLIYFATVVSIVAFDLLTGVIVGFVLALLKLLATFSHLVVRIEDEPRRKRTTLHLEGAATFLRLPRLAAHLETVPPGRELHVHFEHLDYIDHACLDLLINWQKQHEATGGSLAIDWESLHARFRQPGKNGNGNSGNGSDKHQTRNGHNGDEHHRSGLVKQHAKSA
jgi:MFS superfamily sulfate permease-like transporter